MTTPTPDHSPSAKMIVHPEDIVISRSVMDEWMKVLFFLLLLAQMVYAAKYLPWATQSLDLGYWFGYSIKVGLPLFGLPPLVMLAVILHDLLNYRYVICKDYVLEINGLFSFNLNTIRIHYEQIKGVEIEFKFHQRFVNVGNIRLGGALGLEMQEIVLRGLPKPRYYKDIIQKRINEHRLSRQLRHHAEEEAKVEKMG